MIGLPLEALGALAVLALTDSLSVGTLLIPVWLLTTPGRLRLGRILLYLGTVLAAYFAIGVALLAGGRAVFERFGEVLQAPVFLVLQLALGAALIVVSFAMDTAAARARAAQRAAVPGRIARFRDRAMAEAPQGHGGSAGHGTSAVSAVIALALLAVLVEAASMLPYIAATGIIATQTTTWPAALVVLAGYCALMIAPALLLTVGRLAARTQIEPLLRRLEAWLTRHARSTTLWVVGIAGFILAASAIQSLGWLTR